MIEVKAFIRSFYVAWTPVHELDVVGYRVHAAKAADLVDGDLIPTANNIVYEGPETSVLHILPDGEYGGMYFIKVGAVDSFGADEMNYSELLSINVPDLQIMPDELFTTLRTDFYLRDTTFLFGIVDENGERSNETTLYWDTGWLDRADKTYILTAGSIASAQDSYIIATLLEVEDDIGQATLSKTAFGSGLPALEPNQIIVATTTGTPNAVGNYMAYVRQGNSMMMEGAYIRDATIGDAKIYGVLSANKIQTLNGSVEIDGTGITLNEIQTVADGGAAAAEEALAALSEYASDDMLTPLEKSSLKLAVDTIIAEYPTILSQASIYGLSTAQYTGAYTSLIEYVAPLLVSLSETSPIDGATYRGAFTSYYNERTELNKQLTDTVNVDLSTAVAVLDTFASDSKLTPLEKSAIKMEYDAILGEYPSLIGQAATYSCNTSTYVNSYNALVAYLNPLLSDLNATSDIVATTFRSKFTAYYTAKASLSKAVTDAAKSAINIAAGAADSAYDYATDAYAAAQAAATTASWGSISGIPSRFGSAPVGSGLYLTASNMGYYTGGTWKTYMDNVGNFYLSGSDLTGSLAWNASNNTLRVRGDIEASSLKAGTIIGQNITVSSPSGQIKSANYVNRVSGWAINYAGSAEFSSLTARGDIEASSLKANTAMINTLHINGNQVTVPVGATGSGTIPSVSMSLTVACRVFITAAATSQALSTAAEDTSFGVTITVDGVAQTSWHVSIANNYTGSATAVWSGVLSAGSHTISGSTYTAKPTGRSVTSTSIFAIGAQR